MAQIILNPGLDTLVVVDNRAYRCVYSTAERLSQHINEMLGYAAQANKPGAIDVELKLHCAAAWAGQLFSALNWALNNGEAEDTGEYSPVRFATMRKETADNAAAASKLAAKRA